MPSDKRKIRRIRIQFPDMLILPELPDYWNNNYSEPRRRKKK